MIEAVALAALVAWARPPRSGPARRDESASTEIDVVRLLSVAVAAGLPLSTGLAEIAPEIRGPLRDEIERALAEARLDGLGPALADVDGTLGPLFRHLASAHAAGSPVAATLSAHAAAIRERDRGIRLRRARILGVQLVIPLTLLLLPGFAALVLGPPILSQLASLGVP